MKTIKELEQYFKGTNYSIVDGCLYRTVCNTKGESTYRIANFVAYIGGEEIYSDGADNRRYFVIEGIHSEGYPLPPIKVLSTDFSTCTWITKCWGAKCNIEPPSSNKEIMRHAIQCTAKNTVERLTFGHLGFRKLNNRWIYIHANGAIGANNISVELNKRLENYYLSNHYPANDSFKALIDEMFIPHSISIPLLCITFLSPLNEFLKQAGIEPKSVLYLLGKTGSKKSTIAALFLSHFGNFSNTELPLSFRDTENSIIEQSFLLKDTLTVIDDFHPSSKLDEMNMNKTAQTIMRGYGDRVGKNRLRCDISLIPSKPPRGNAIITGESLPEISESGTARYIALEIKKEDINTSLLTDLQEKAKNGYLSASMYQYIEWIVSLVNEKENDFITWLKEHFITFRSKFQRNLQENKIEVHSRIPESIAWLYLGFYVLLNFQLTINIISKVEFDELIKKCCNVLYILAVSQANSIALDSPTKKFIKKLNSLLMSKAVYVEIIKQKNISQSEGFIGYEDDEYYYLITDIAHKRVKRLCEEQGELFTISARGLLKQLADENIIKSKGSDRTLPLRVGETVNKYMWIDKNVFSQIIS